MNELWAVSPERAVIRLFEHQMEAETFSCLFLLLSFRETLNILSESFRQNCVLDSTTDSWTV